MTINKIFTHTDLDGAVSAVVGSLLCNEGNPKIFSLGNNEADDGVLTNTHEGDSILIVDLPLKEETIVSVSEKLGRGSVLYVDHHEGSRSLQDKYPFCHYSHSECGASLLMSTIYAYVSDQAKAKKLFPLVALARDYDLWIHDKPESRQMDVLLRFVGFESFVCRFINNPDVEFTDFEKGIIKRLADKKESYIDKAKANFTKYSISGIEGVAAVTFETAYISDLLHTILAENNDVDYAVSINLALGIASLRSRKRTKKALEVATKFDGGGHPSAAGFSLDKIKVSQIVFDCIFKEEA